MYNQFDSKGTHTRAWLTDLGLAQVWEFHSTCEIPILKQPKIPSKDRCDFRIRLLKEEFIELKDGIEASDLKEIFDALLDLQYALDGTFLEFGMHKIKPHGQNEVHRSNMTKLDKDGLPIKREDGKILKGPNYSPPNLKQFLDK